MNREIKLPFKTWMLYSLNVENIILILLIISFNVSGFNDSFNFDPNQPSKRVLLQMVFRHGDRSPIHIYQGDPNTKSVWPSGLGQLTTTGMREAFNFGKRLREMYADIVSHEYMRSEVFIQSTDFDRTLMTVQCLLTGLYPANLTDWPLATWQPIPVHTEIAKADQLFGYAPCPLGEDLNHKWTSTAEIVSDFNKKYKSLYENLTRQLGMEITQSSAHSIADTVFCERRHNFQQPEWMTEEMILQLMSLRNDSNQLAQAAPGTARLYGGPLLAEISKNMKNYVDSKSSYKLYLFSGHDTTVSALGRAMGIFNNLQPPYLCSIMVELHKQNTEFFVKVLFHNGTVDSPYVMRITGCQEMCPLDMFQRLLKSEILPAKDRKSACALPSTLETLGQNAVPILVGVMLVLIVLMGVTTYKCIMYKKMKRTSRLQYGRLLQESGDIDTEEEELD